MLALATPARVRYARAEVLTLRVSSLRSCCHGEALMLALDAIDAHLDALRLEKAAQRRTTDIWWVTWREDIDAELDARFALCPVKVSRSVARPSPACSPAAPALPA